MNPILVTGVAGFIGFHTAKKLLDAGKEVLGVDNLSPYYSVQLKKDRLAALHSPLFTFIEIDLADKNKTAELFSEFKFDWVIHLAAQAGVRYSIDNPHAYGDSNLVGFLNILEGCRHQKINHLVYASSSSVYGSNQEKPFSVSQNVDHPISLYAATKKANELMAHTYSHLYQIPTTGLRFFTVYGPWGRPDMAIFKFTKAMLEGKPIDVYNHGQMKRDFTYIDDIVEGVIRVSEKIPQFYSLYNIGNNKPVELEYLIEVLEKTLGKKAIKNYLPLQPGDVPETYADIDDLVRDVGFKPSTSIEVGIKTFIEWYRAHHNIQ